MKEPSVELFFLGALRERRIKKNTLTSRSSQKNIEAWKSKKNNSIIKYPLIAAIGPDIIIVGIKLKRNNSPLGILSYYPGEWFNCR